MQEKGRLSHKEFRAFLKTSKSVSPLILFAWYTTGLKGYRLALKSIPGPGPGGIFHLAKGDILSAYGKYEQALQQYLRAEKIAPDNSRVRKHILYTLAGLGWFEKLDERLARPEFRRVAGQDIVYRHHIRRRQYLKAINATRPA